MFCMNKNETRLTVIGILNKLFLLCMIFAACMLIYRMYSDARQKNMEDDIRNAINSALGEEIIFETVPTDELIVSETNSEAAPENREPIQACMDAYMQNDDFVAILKAGEDTALYVVQCDDNSYYMDHDFYGNYNEAGNAFLDYRCSMTPRDTHLIIHGHNMKNGSVFGKLDDFRVLDYLKEYPVITYVNMYETEYYVPYAILDISAQKDNAEYYKVTEWNFETEEALREFTDELINRSYYDIPIDIAHDDALLTLATCSYDVENGRLLIACRRLRADETPEIIAEIMQEATEK